MRYAFDSRAFADLVKETERFATFLREHEERLSRLVTRLEREPDARVLEEVRGLYLDALANWSGRTSGPVEVTAPPADQVATPPGS